MNTACILDKLFPTPVEYRDRAAKLSLNDEETSKTDILAILFSAVPSNVLPRLGENPI